MSQASKLLISPLVGEMPGRAEGGAKELNCWKSITPHSTNDQAVLTATVSLSQVPILLPRRSGEIGFGR